MFRSARILLLASLVSVTSFADEGMWTFEDYPLQMINARHGINLNSEWLDRIRLAAVRINGCTASFVSPQGLLLTNHHCVTACLAENSGKDQSLLDTGFLAADRKQELPCRVQVADILIATENITDQVARAIAGLDAQQANTARRQLLTKLESECEANSARDKRTGPLKCQSVDLYDGGRHLLYKYRRYTDIRLVFAPEADVAAFGGDPDNFQFPRWCLDMALLRAYDKSGNPVTSPSFLPLDFKGPSSGDTVFVAGNPGGTSRLLTVAQYRWLRDVDLPSGLLRSSELRGRYIQFGKTSESAARITAEPLQSLENGIKVRRKLLDALHSESLMAAKTTAEQSLRKQALQRSDLGADFGDPWMDIERALAVEQEFETEHRFLEGGAGFNSRLFSYARSLVRLAAERPKSNTERLREYTDAALPRLEQRLVANVPVYPELEQLTLSFSLERMREWLGPDHAVVRQLLSRESPDALAKRLVEGTRLADPAARKMLLDGGAAAIAASNDPMIELARNVDAESRRLRQRKEDEVDARINAATERIARARFAVFGTAVYPDATSTLRLNDGRVQSWRENGRDVEPVTRLSRLFERATGSRPFQLPDRWINAKDSLDLATPFNLVTNNDIIGGNSGSPLISVRGSIVGLLFDGNIHSISGDYWFDTERNRAVAVHPAIMREALAKVYEADNLLRELGAKPPRRKRLRS